MRHELKFNGAEDLEWAGRAHMERAKLGHNRDTRITSLWQQQHSHMYREHQF